MKGILYYLLKNGNKDFTDLPFNEADSLILSQISYLFFERLIDDNNIYSLRDFLTIDNVEKLCESSMSYKKNKKLATILCNSNRFLNLKISDIKHIFNVEEEIQYFSMTFHFPNFLYVAFRGTDLSIIGWKEDFNMLYKEYIPSQEYARIYLDEIYDKYKMPLCIGGHSKGGNLAFYSSMYAKISTINNIIRIYNFDGPGLKDKKILSSVEYSRIQDKLITYSSTYSTVAMLMYHVKDIEFLKCRSIGVLQHDAYNWVIKDNNLRRVKNNDVTSKIFDKACDIYIENTNNVERKRMVNLFFYITEDNPHASLIEFKRHFFKKLRGMRMRKKRLSKDDLDFYNRMVKKIFKCIRMAFRTYKVVEQ